MQRLFMRCTCATLSRLVFRKYRTEKKAQTSSGRIQMWTQAKMYRNLYMLKKQNTAKGLDKLYTLGHYATITQHGTQAIYYLFLLPYNIFPANGGRVFGVLQLGYLFYGGKTFGSHGVLLDQIPTFSSVVSLPHSFWRWNTPSWGFGTSQLLVTLHLQTEQKSLL